MRAIGRSPLPLFFLPLLLGAGSPTLSGNRPPSRVQFPNLSVPIDAEKSHVDPSLETVTQERMTLPQLQAFFNTLDRGVAVRLVYRNGSEYSGNYSGGDTVKPQIYCRKGLAAPEAVPLEAVTDAYVFVTDTHLVRVHLPD